MVKTEMDLDEETLGTISELAEELETTRADVVRDLLSYALKHMDEIYSDEEPT
ncbi:MAG: ribbon-helix-helix protein, CopG family [Thermoplasmata archaeon]